MIMDVGVGAALAFHANGFPAAVPTDPFRAGLALAKLFLDEAFPMFKLGVWQVV
jgi:hypothetical protein